MAYTVTSLQPGDLILVAGVHWTAGIGAGLLDWLIQVSTGSPVHHALIVGDGVLIQSLWTVSAAPLDTYAADGWAFRVPTATPAQRAAAVAWAHAHLGASYGVREIALDAARYDLHWVPRRVAPLRHYTCSGLVALAYQQAGMPLTYAPWPSPGDLLDSPALVGPRPRS